MDVDALVDRLLLLLLPPVYNRHCYFLFHSPLTSHCFHIRYFLQTFSLDCWLFWWLL